MKRRFFGTDGVRGPYGGPLVNDALAWRLGAAAARHYRSLGARPGAAVLIGRDTRQSGPVLAAAVARGLAAEGMAPVDLGILPTPAVARAVREQGAAFGVVITASHNPAADNGIKLFGPDGNKPGDADEEGIERRLDSIQAADGPAAGAMAFPLLEAAAEDYARAVAGLLAPGALRGWTVALDTAHGAAARTSPKILRDLGAAVIGIGDAPDGRNINADVGSEHPEALCALVRRNGARLGLAQDGDGDRCVLCDETGSMLDGDEILTLLAVHALGRGGLPAKTLVVTVQSNLGVDAAVEAAGGRVVRTPIGDRHVAERMRAEGAGLGGESSGHIICAEVSTTGDGLVAALKVAGIMLATGRPLSALRQALRKFPQLSRAVAVRGKPPLESLPGVTAAIAAATAELGSRGRVLVRYSGTEPKIRLLTEGPDPKAVAIGMERLERAVQAELGGGPAS
jgi:phosphoglucosamine mutase